MKKTNIIIVIVVIAIIMTGIVGYFILREKQTSNEIPYYFIAIHNEPLHDFPNAGYLIEENYNILREMVEKANEYNIKLTLMISAQVADYIAEDPGRLAELRTWESQGHEIAAHHHSIYHGNWDGYTGYTEEEAIAERPNYMSDYILPVPETYLGTMADYISHVKKVNPNVNSGCMNAERSRMDFPDEIIYDTCSGYANFGEPGTLLPDSSGQKGKNEFILVRTFNGIERKWLSHSQITDRKKLDNAKTNFLSTGSSNVYGAVIHNTHNGDQDAYFLEYLDFLHELDPKGEKSVTLTGAIEDLGLPEEKIEIK